MSNKVADGINLDYANAYSRKVLDALRDWDFVRRGQWTTWDGGEVALQVTTTPSGVPCEQVAIVASKDCIALTTRDFELMIGPNQTFEAGISDLKDFVRGWFAGEILIASFFLGDTWVASTPIDARRRADELGEAFKWVRTRAQTDRVVVQGPFRDKDERLAIAVDGQLLDGGGAVN